MQKYVLISFFLLFSFSSSKTTYGMVEGFYWPISEAVDGRYGDYTHDERRNILKTMNSLNLTVYVYGPKELIGENYERAYNISLIGDLNEWKTTFLMAKTYNIQFLWSISPGWIPTNPIDFEGIFKKMLYLVKTLQSIGCIGFILSLDDTPGGASEDQYGMHAKLIHQLEAQLGNSLFKAYIPGYYSGSASDISAKLAIIDKFLQKDINFVWTGKNIWNREIYASDIPILPSGRKFILWDNWMSSDSSSIDKLILDPAEYREKTLLDNIFQYWINPVFPGYRIIPALGSVSQIMKAGEANFSMYWNNDKKVYFDENQICAVLRKNAQIWCFFFFQNCNGDMIEAHYQLLRGINYMSFDKSKLMTRLFNGKLIPLVNYALNLD